ncbi:MAG TPA: ABC transporter permease [Vicinamibacterales bacterium]
MRSLRALWHNLRHRDRVEQQLDDELRATLDLLIDEKVAAGVEPREARRRAIMELGGIEPVKERIRDARMGVRIESLLHDVKYALRHFRRSPGFAISAVLTLAIGIGANAAMVSIVNALLFKRLPVPDPDGLVSLVSVDDRGRERYFPYAAADAFLENGPFKNLCGYNGGGVSTIEAGGVPSIALYAFVSGSCFDVFGVSPIIGRAIVAEDAPWERAGNKVALISHRFWTRVFNADPAIVGKTFRVETIELSVIGVMPEGFGGLHIDTAVDFFVPPDTIFPAPKERRPVATQLVGRLRDGVTFEQAAVQLEAMWPQVKAATTGDPSKASEGAALYGTTTRLDRMGTGISSTLRRQYGSAFRMMAALTALLLVLMCVNVGGLLLTRLSARSNELAVRLAIGGSRQRVAQQMLVEGLVLSIAGTALAIPLAFGLIAPITAFMPQNRIARTIELTPDASILALMAVIGVIVGVLITALPVWLALRRQVSSPLIWDRTVAPATNWWARSLLIAQVAVSVVILIGASLLVRSLYLLQQVDTGVQAANVVDVDLLPLPRGRFATPAERTANVLPYYTGMLERIAALPGVESVGMSQAFPRQTLPPSTPVSFVGQPDSDIIASADSVSPGFFETMGVPLIAGRFFTWADSSPTARVCIVSESLARKLEPNGDVLQRHIRYGTLRDRQDMVIVGVVGNMTLGNLRHEQPPIAFVPPQSNGVNFSAPNILIKTTRSMEWIARAVRGILADGGREYAREIITVEELFARSPASERMTATLAGMMGFLAILIAVIGIHGVLAYSVSRRTREIGVRVAVGANPATVARSVIREAAVLTLIGLVIGVPVAFAASQSLRSLLYGISETDTITFAAAAMFFLLVGVIAGVLPAKRAANVDPVIALRGD